MFRKGDLNNKENHDRTSGTAGSQQKQEVCCFYHKRIALNYLIREQISVLWVNSQLTHQSLLLRHISAYFLEEPSPLGLSLIIASDFQTGKKK